MGKQVNFYMTEEDEQGFVEFVKTTAKIGIIPYRMSSPSERLDDLPSPEPTGFWVFVYLHNESIAGQLAIKFDDFKQKYYVNPLYSPVVEFWRSDWSGQVLYPGRIWAEMYQPNLETGTLELHEEFKKWYEKITRWLKRRYKRVDVLTYAGPGALKFQEEGGRFHG